VSFHEKHFIPILHRVLGGAGAMLFGALMLAVFQHIGPGASQGYGGPSAEPSQKDYGYSDFSADRGDSGYYDYGIYDYRDTATPSKNISH
jgi:hypothetical protein